MTHARHNNSPLRDAAHETPHEQAGPATACSCEAWVNAFTLIELLVVIAIIGIVVAITFPMVNKLTEGVDEAAGVNAATIAIDVARGYSEKQNTSFGKTIWTWAASPPTGSPYSAVGGAGRFSGVAALFTPAGEIRLVENNEDAIGNNAGAGVPLEDYEPVPGNRDQYNGYTDIIGIDYVTLPSDAGVAGLFRDGTGVAGLAILPPPFAVRFDEDGRLMASDATNFQAIFYDANYSGFYELTGAGRDRANPTGGGTYNPDNWIQDGSQTVKHATTNKWTLPFERIEAVVGVIVYSKAAFRGGGNDWTDTVAADIQTRNAWLLDPDNGKLLLVSRYTGTVMREPETAP